MLPKILAAEAYFGYLLDGSVLRIYYQGLKAAIGGTLNEAKSRSEFSILPLTMDFRHVSWTNFHAPSLAQAAKSIGYCLRVEPSLVQLFLDLMMATR
jgi:hypothetical protein